MNTNQRNEGAEKTSKGTAFSKSCIQCAKAILEQIRNARERVLSEARETVEVHEHLLRLAVNEAEALAWQTLYPQLFFPDLAAEKIQGAAHWNRRQQFVA